MTSDERYTELCRRWEAEGCPDTVEGLTGLVGMELGIDDATSRTVIRHVIECAKQGVDEGRPPHAIAGAAFQQGLAFARFARQLDDEAL